MWTGAWPVSPNILLKSTRQETHNTVLLLWFWWPQLPTESAKGGKLYLSSRFQNISAHHGREVPESRDWVSFTDPAQWPTSTCQTSSWGTSILKHTPLGTFLIQPRKVTINPLSGSVCVPLFASREGCCPPRQRRIHPFPAILPHKVKFTYRVELQAMEKSRDSVLLHSCCSSSQSRLQKVNTTDCSHGAYFQEGCLSAVHTRRVTLWENKLSAGMSEKGLAPFSIEGIVPTKKSWYRNPEALCQMWCLWRSFPIL